MNIKEDIMRMEENKSIGSRFEWSAFKKEVGRLLSENKTLKMQLKNTKQERKRHLKDKQHFRHLINNVHLN